MRQIDKLPLPVKDSPGFLVNRVLGPTCRTPSACSTRASSPRRSTRRWRSSACRWGRPSSPTPSASTSASHAGKALAEGRRDRGAADPRQQGRARPPRQEDRPGHLPLRERQAGQGPARRVRPDADRRADRALPERSRRPCCAEGIVADADLIDAGLIFGTGFAPFRGGPLHYSEKHAWQAKPTP